MSEIFPKSRDGFDEKEMAQLKALDQHTVVEFGGIKYLLLITRGKKLSVTITAERLVDIIHIDEASGSFISLKKKIDLLSALLWQISELSNFGNSPVSTTSDPLKKARKPKSGITVSGLPFSVVQQLKSWINGNISSDPISH